MKSCFIITIISILLLNSTLLFGQETDSVKSTPKKFVLIPKEHSPRVAGVASAILPGLGQAYNKKYWKVPVVYAGVAVTGYFIYKNYTIYNNFRQAYIYSHDTDPSTNLESFSVWGISRNKTYFPSLYDDARQLEIIDGYRKYLDLSIIAAAAVYGLNILDAVVDAHLYHFDVSDNLSMTILPSPPPDFHRLSSTGVTLRLQF